MTFNGVDQAKAAWDAAIPLLREGGMGERQARTFFGRLLSQYKIGADVLLGAIHMAKQLGTKDPASYLVKAAQARRTANNDPALKADWT